MIDPCSFGYLVGNFWKRLWTFSLIMCTCNPDNNAIYVAIGT